MLTLAIGLVGKMLTNANKGTYLVKSWQKYANVIYERSLTGRNDVKGYSYNGQYFKNGEQEEPEGMHY